MSLTNLALRRFASCPMIRIAALALPMLPAACVERKETIQVLPDGRVNFTVVQRSDSENDLYEGDAVPSIRGGWIVAENVEEDDSGRDWFGFTAEASYAWGKPLPANLADRGDPDADLALQFPTELKIERRGKETYYHFARAYEPRPWAQIDAHRQAMENDMESLKEKPMPEWTADERGKVVQGFLKVEFIKRRTFARAAYLEIMGDKRQDGWLALHQDLLNYFSTLDAQRLARLLLEDDEPAANDPAAEKDAGVAGDRQKLLDEEMAKLERECAALMQESLRSSAPLSGEQVSAFLHEYARQRRFHEITEDLGDDTLEITIEMPGTIVGSNADRVDGGKAVWNLSGAQVRDQRVELLVSSHSPR